MRKVLLVLVSLGMSLFSFEAAAQKASDLEAVETYLNSIKTLKASFVQTSSNGGTAEGTLKIAKPNKIRMEYGEPTNVLIVGDGKYIIYNDKDLDQVTHIDYKDVPASLILADDVKIDGKNIKVVDFYQDAGSTSITLDYKKKGDIGPITLIFSNNPMELKQWKIVDPQKIEVVVSMYDMEKDVELDEALFKFKDKKSSPLNYKNKR